MEAWNDLRATTHLVIWTIGHSTRSFEEFFDLLAENRIQRLADVRHYATSRRGSWGTKTTPPVGLYQRGIFYDHIEGLGRVLQTHACHGDRARRQAAGFGDARRMRLSCIPAA